jgi:alpha/beta superfamily hydrolase
LFISGSRDEFSPKEKLEQVFAVAADPKKVVFVEGAGHFFEKKLEQMQNAIREWLPSVLPL